jgi:hypothetical protein
LNESNNLEEFEIEIQSLLAKTAAKARNNWIQLFLARAGNLLWRIYGPEQGWYDKKCRPSEIEEIEQLVH